MNMKAKQSDLMVIAKAKELCSYVMKITDNMPKKYRYTLATKMQNLCIGIIEDLYMANETYIGKKNLSTRYPIRRNYQHTALTKIKMLAYFAHLAIEQKAILFKQYAQISLLTTDCQNLVGGWINSDKKRWFSQKQLSS